MNFVLHGLSKLKVVAAAHFLLSISVDGFSGGCNEFRNLGTTIFLYTKSCVSNAAADVICTKD